MAIIDIAFLALWLGLFAYWAVSAIGAKPTLGGRRAWGRDIAIRAGILILVLAALRLPFSGAALRSARGAVINTDPLVGAIGLLICALGVGLALWARTVIGRNWGMPMTRKADPELVTDGPYAVIRHPIYTGLLLAVFGSAIGLSLLWLLPLAVFTVYFVTSAWREEQQMLRQFPRRYPAYRQRTKMLVPFLF